MTTFGPDGIYTIWNSGYLVEDTLSMPVVVGTQWAAEWSQVEQGDEGVYTWRGYEDHLELASNYNKSVTFQIGAKLQFRPAYLTETVPYVIDVAGGTVSNDSPAGSTVHMYWHPNYIAAYANMLNSLGEMIRSSPYRHALIGVKMNINAIQTEGNGGIVKPAYWDASLWTVPPGVTPDPVDYTEDRRKEYITAVADAHKAAFTDGDPFVMAFLRNHIFAEADDLFSSPAKDAEYSALVDANQMGLHQTSSKYQPDSTQQTGQYTVFLNHKTSKNIYAEAWGTADSQHPPEITAAMWDYWRLLNDLHAGTSFMGVRRDDLLYVLEPTDLDRAAQEAEAFEFTDRYCGNLSDPSTAAGCWVALREGTGLPGDYNFSMTRVAGDANTAMTRTALTQPDLGPEEQRYGVWARRIESAGIMRFLIDDSAAQYLNGWRLSLRIVYLDSGSGDIAVEAFGAQYIIEKQNTGIWQESDINTKYFSSFSPSDGYHIKLTAVDESATLHMVEIQRRSAPGSGNYVTSDFPNVTENVRTKRARG